MSAECQQNRVATKKQVEELRRTAVEELHSAGYAEPSEQAIQSRLQTLLAQRGLALRNLRKSKTKMSGLLGSFSRGLALIQTFCQGKVHKADQRQAAKRKGIPEPERPGEIPYYFAAIPDDYVDHFARYLPVSATSVLLTLWRYSKMKMQTWVSLKTLCVKTHLSRNTVRRDLRLLAECKIVIKEFAGGKDFNGDVIDKGQGDKYWLNWPAAWDREKAKGLDWRSRGVDKSVDKRGVKE
jgi:hypothetical protein